MKSAVLIIVFLNFGTLIECQLALDLEGENTAIDFSGGVEEADGTICVTREEEVEDLEQKQEQQCTQQNVTQCYNTYVTKYSNAKREKCEDVFVKTCRIVQRPKTYNHTVRMCKRPLVKKCHTYQESLPVYGGGYAAPPNQGYGPPSHSYGAPAPSYGSYAAHPSTEPPTVVCKDLYETVCNTSVLVGDDGVSGGLPVTQCNQELRQICAEDKCKIVEGDPECFEKTVENVVKVPEETCSMEPNTECRNVTISIPNLVPEEKCRVVPKEVCQTVFLNPSTTTKTELVKYCMNTETGVVRQEGDGFSQVTGDDVDNGGGLNINNNARNALLRQRAPAPRGFNPVNVNFNELPSELRHRSRFI